MGSLHSQTMEKCAVLTVGYTHVLNEVFTYIYSEMVKDPNVEESASVDLELIQVTLYVTIVFLLCF